MNTRKRWTAEEEARFIMRYEELKDETTSDMDVCELLAEDFGRTASSLYNRLNRVKAEEEQPPASFEQVRGFLDFIEKENEELKKEVLELKKQLVEYEQMKKDYETIVAIMDRSRKDVLGISSKRMRIDGNGVVETYES